MPCPHLSNKEWGFISFMQKGCIDIRFIYKFYVARLGAARRALQLQHRYVVWRRGNKHIPWNIKGQLRTTGWPVATKVKAIDPNLPLCPTRKTDIGVLWQVWNPSRNWKSTGVKCRYFVTQCFDSRCLLVMKGINNVIVHCSIYV